MQKTSQVRFARVVRAGLAVAAVALGSLLGSVEVGAALKGEEAQARYRSVLSVLASDGVAPALESLEALESEVVGATPSHNRIVSFWKLKLGVIREILEEQPIDVLVPIMMLHHEAYGFYLERGNGILAGHARTMAAELADIYANKARTPQASVVAGWVLASFGAQMQQWSGIRASTDFYYRAVDLDPSNRLALLNIAVNLEKVGRYPKAIEYLERLLKIWPDDPAGRLRLANCQLRTLYAYPGDGQEILRRKALKTLELLARGGEADWIRSVAYQEWVRELRAVDRVSEAEEILREGLAALPGDRQLKILLVSLLERSRRRSEANRVLDEIKAGLPASVSARQIYDTFPHAGLEEAREKLLAEMTDRMTLLAEGMRPASVEVGS